MEREQRVKFFARKDGFLSSGHIFIGIVFHCPFVRELIISGAHEPCKSARWPHYKSRLPHLRGANRRLRSSASRWWQRRPINYQGQTRRRREEGLGAYRRQMRSED